MAARESESEDSDEWSNESEDDDEWRVAPPWPFTGKPGRLGDNGSVSSQQRAQFCITGNTAC